MGRDLTRNTYQMAVPLSKTPTETERKFLVREIPHLEQWPVLFTDVYIHQTYLRREDGKAERLRRARAYDLVQYTHCLKTPQGLGTCLEEEAKISGSEYRRLLSLHQAEISGVVTKTRRMFRGWEGGLTFELDMFTAPGRLMVLEVELDHIDQAIDFPPFIEVGREVTHDKRFSNAWIAANGIPDCLGR